MPAARVPRAREGAKGWISLPKSPTRSHSGVGCGAIGLRRIIGRVLLTLAVRIQDQGTKVIAQLVQRGFRSLGWIWRQSAWLRWPLRGSGDDDRG